MYPITDRARKGLPPPEDPRAAWEERIGAFRACLPPLGEQRVVVFRDLMVLVALRCGYDARTRCGRMLVYVCVFIIIIIVMFLAFCQPA